MATLREAKRLVVKIGSALLVDRASGTLRADWLRSLAADVARLSARGVQVHYGTNHALKDVDVEILDRAVTAFIGPSGCGKSTFLRCLNRMNDTVASARVTGKILLDGEDIYDPRVDPVRHDPRFNEFLAKLKPHR